LLTATKVIEAGSRPQRPAAAAMRWRTMSRPSLIWLNESEEVTPANTIGPPFVERVCRA